MWLRRTMDESEAFIEEVAAKGAADLPDGKPEQGGIRMLLQYPRECLLVCAPTLAIFGGTVETVALALERTGHESLFFYYMTGCIAVSLVVYFFMRETSDSSPLDRASPRKDTPDEHADLATSRKGTTCRSRWSRTTTESATPSSNPSPPTAIGRSVCGAAPTCSSATATSTSPS